LPFDEEHRHLVAPLPDGSDSTYCTYCFRDGAFLDPDATVEDMIEVGVPHLAAKVGEETARVELGRYLPTLDRWRSSAG